MKSVSFSNLPDELGINPLTGEACAYSMRILCDLNVDGTALVCDFLGLPAIDWKAAQGPFAPNWNSTVGSRPSVASIMLPRSIFPELVRFALFRRGFQYVLQGDGATDASGLKDEDLESGYSSLSLILDGTSAMLKENGGHLLLWRNPRNPGAVGSRNVHQFTGRTV